MILTAIAQGIWNLLFKHWRSSVWRNAFLMNVASFQPLEEGGVNNVDVR